jgi:predicted DNA-binding transcriptional regulator YafY
MVDVYLEADRVYVDLPQRFTRPTRLPADELLSLLLALSPLRRSGLPDLADRAKRLGDKLTELAADHARGLAPEIEDRVVVESPGAETPEHLRALEAAVEGHRVVKVEYYSAHRDVMTERELRPVALLSYRTGWYVLSAEDKLFKVERIRALEATDETFEPPEGLDLERYRRGVFGGDSPASFVAEVRVGGRDERWPTFSAHRLRGWLRLQRGQVQLLGPPAEREELLQEVRELLARHEDSP